MLDLYRITPVDVHWIETYWDESASNCEDSAARKKYPHRMSVLRPELIESYWRMKLSEYVKEELAKKQNGSPSSKVTPEQDGTTASEGQSNAEGQPKTNGELVESGTQNNHEDEDQKTNDNERVDISGFQYALNPDVFCGQMPQTQDEKDQWVKDEEEVRAVSRHLIDEVIPRLMHDIQEGEVGFPMDGQSLSSLLHKRGVNIRYLGKIANIASKSERRHLALKELAEQEMIARAFKHVANRYLRSTPAPLATACASHLLNCLLGAGINEKPVAEFDKSVKELYTPDKLDFEGLTPASLQQAISEQVDVRYQYALASDWTSRIVALRLLREVCLKLGLQIAARDYTFIHVQNHVNGSSPQAAEVNGNLAPMTNGHASSGSKKKRKAGVSPNRAAPEAAHATLQTFHADDIYNIVPVMKEASPRSVLAEEAFEAGRISVAQNQKDLGQELLFESLSLHEQIYGILHPEVARAYYQLSTLFYSLDDKPIAVELARKAVIVSERTLGVDSHETLLAYLNLGLFEHATGNSHLALTYVRHALDIWKIIYGPSHPDSITTLNNAAVMLQHLKLYHDSRTWFEASLAISMQVSGPQSINTATLLFQLAQALALDQDSKAAVGRMREAYNIFHSLLGPNDRNTKEAETWLENLTQNAVSIAKHAKDVQARRLRRFNHLSPRVTLGTRPQPPSGQSERALPTRTGARGFPDGLDERSIDELMKYIEGGEAAKQSTPKKRPTNPKRRR